jgi:hypothetical protein
LIIIYLFFSEQNRFLFKRFVIRENSKSALGCLLSVDNEDGVVQRHGNISDDDTALISLKYLCKCI